MSFFASIPEPPRPRLDRPEQPSWMRQETVIPGGVPGEAVIARTGRAAVAAGSIRAYPNGFEFALHVRVRGDDGLGLSADPFGQRDPRHREAAGDQLRLGVQFADGRRAATTGGHSWPGDGVDAGQLILIPAGSSGSDISWDGDFWVHPLPPDGPVTIVVAWPYYEIAETRTEFDGAAIRAAAGQAVTLWPDAG